GMEPWVFDGVEQVRWLVEHPLPLYLCVVDKSCARIRLYHTCPRFYAWSLPPLPNRLELVPTLDEQGMYVKWEGGKTFSLTAPILELAIEDLCKDDNGSIAEVLNCWLEIDRKNLNRIQNGIYQFEMPYEYRTNATMYAQGKVTQGITRALDLSTAAASLE